MPPILRYPLMGQALNRTGRQMNYMCNFPWQLWGNGACPRQPRGDGRGVDSGVLQQLADVW